MQQRPAHKTEHEDSSRYEPPCAAATHPGPHPIQLFQPVARSALESFQRLIEQGICLAVQLHLMRLIGREPAFGVCAQMLTREAATRCEGMAIGRSGRHGAKG